MTRPIELKEGDRVICKGHDSIPKGARGVVIDDKGYDWRHGIIPIAWEPPYGHWNTEHPDRKGWAISRKCLRKLPERREQ